MAVSDPWAIDRQREWLRAQACGGDSFNQKIHTVADTLDAAIARAEAAEAEKAEQVATMIACVLASGGRVNVFPGHMQQAKRYTLEVTKLADRYVVRAVLKSAIRDSAQRALDDLADENRRLGLDY